MGKDIIVFGDDWGSLSSSTQHLIRHLSAQRKIIWVNSIGLKRLTLNLRTLRRIKKKLFCRHSADIRKTVTKLANPNFILINPLTIPVPRYKITRHIAASLLMHQLTKVMTEFDIDKPILWLSIPTAVDMVGRLGECSVVYYCGEDFSSVEGIDHKTVAQRESQLVKCADLILTASDVLREKFPLAISRTLPNGVDFKFFSTPMKRADDLPNDGRPIAGFYGRISEKLDIELLIPVVAHLHHWHFVFIGDIEVDINDLACYSNVSFLGPRAYEVLPSYSQHWTVSMLPFCNNARIKAANPLKLTEYLASGRPVVSTALPALKPYFTLIDVITDAASMVEALERAVIRDVLVASRCAVSHETWAKRAAQVAILVDAL